MAIKSRILYIEDNKLAQRLISRMLRATGNTLALAGTGRVGIASALEDPPDLILLDINLPDIDGLSVVRLLKSTAQSRHIPVIALTANTMYGGRIHCLQAGCDEYLAKPIMRTELLNMVEQFLYASHDNSVS